MHRPSDARCCFRRRTGGLLLQLLEVFQCSPAALHMRNSAHVPPAHPSSGRCSALAHLASASGVSREREEFMELVEKEIGRYRTALLYCCLL